MNKELYQIGLPASSLSTVFMLWIAYERPGIIPVYPSKKDKDWAVIELRDKKLSAAIVETVKESRLNVVQMPEKVIKI